MCHVYLPTICIDVQGPHVVGGVVTETLANEENVPMEVIEAAIFSALPQDAKTQNVETQPREKVVDLRRRPVINTGCTSPKHFQLALSYFPTQLMISTGISLISDDRYAGDGAQTART